MNAFLPAHTAQGIGQVLRPSLNEFDFDLDQCDFRFLSH